MVLKNGDSKRLSFAHSFKPIYTLSRICGFMPFTIVLDSSGAIQTARVSVLDSLWFIIYIGTYLLSTLYYVTYIMSKQVESTFATLAYATRTIVIFRKLFNCVLITTDLCNRFKLVEILKKISTFDEQVSWNELTIQMYSINFKTRIFWV